MRRILRWTLAAAMLPAGPACQPTEQAADDLRGSVSDGGGADLPPDFRGAPCVSAFSCQARTADHGCGETTATGQRHPDKGGPYCADKKVRERCSCDLIRCSSPGPLCPGTYKVRFRERLLAGCSGVPGDAGGTCPAAWNVVQLYPGGETLAERALMNVDIEWGFADYTQIFTLTGSAPVRLVVQQYCWFADVQGVGNAGRVEVEGAELTPM